MHHSVLIVEDEFLVALDLKDTLEELGYAPVEVAADLPSARALAAIRPAVAFVDVNLRDGPTGPEVGDFLARELGTTVVYLTANPRQLPSTDSALGVLSKPADRGLVEATAQFAVARRRGLPATPPRGFTAFPSAQAATR